MTTTTEATATTALDFLRALRPGGPWVLIAFNPDRNNQGEAITAHSDAEVIEFLRRHNGRWNCYYSLNPTRAPMDKKPAKADIARLEYLLADLDPKPDETPEAAKARYLPQLQAFQPPPTFVVDSGNGLQALWRLETASILSGNQVLNEKGKLEFSKENKAKIDDIEGRSKAIMLALGSAAGTQNIDRILRLPGSINIPTETKLQAGRVRCETRIILMNGPTAKLTDFPEGEKPKAKAKTKAASGEKKTELPQELRHMLFLTGEKPAGYDSRSELLWTFINTAMRKGVDENIIIAATLDAAYANGSIYQHVEDKGGESYVQKQIEHALNASDLPQGQKKLIRIKGGQLDIQWRATERALADSNCPIFVRAGSLVQPLWRFEDAGNGKQVLSAVFVKYNIPRLRDVVGHHAAIFQKIDGRTIPPKWVNIDPPNKVIEALIEARHWIFPDVAGIITSPTMRGDGSLITEPGYDRATQLWYKPSSSIQLGRIGETKEEAQAALAELKSLIVECSLVNDISKSVALAAMMTTVLRGAFKAAPMFFFHKPEPGSGGSYLVKIISTLALGHEAASLNVSEDKKEFPKELSAAAYEAKPILNIGNLTFDLESPLLAQIVSEGIVDIRPFGKNTETMHCDCRYMTVIVNGNNVRVVGELVRRTLTGRLDTKMERPETKEYQGDPLADIHADRSKYLRAVLTIARAYLAYSGEKPEYAKINGFEQWSKFVQQPLVWLGQADPVKSQEDARARDPERGAVRERIMTVVKYFQGHESFEAKDVYAMVTATLPVAPNNNPPKFPDLCDAFTRPDDGKLMSARSIGRLLTKDEGRVVTHLGKDFSIQLKKNNVGEAKVYVVVIKTVTGYEVNPPQTRAILPEMELEEPF